MSQFDAEAHTFRGENGLKAVPFPPSTPIFPDMLLENPSGSNETRFGGDGVWKGGEAREEVEGG